MDKTPYWLAGDDVPSWPTSPFWTVPSAADLVVVGGGIVGLAAALWGARLGADTVVLEQDRLTWGATSRNIGVMLYGGQLDRADLLEHVCDTEQIAERPQTVGHLSLLDTEDYVTAVKQESAQRAETVELLGHAECEALLGTAISRRYLAGRWARSGMVVNPVRFAFGLAAAAARHGARLVVGQRVSRVRPERGGVAIDVGARTIGARAAIIAAASGAAMLLPGLAEVLFPREAHVWRTEATARTFAPGMALNFGDVYWRQLPDGTILLGGGSRLGWSASGSWRRSRSRITAFFRESFPQLPDVRPVAHWAGTMACTRDARPIIGAVPRMPGVWLATGFGGHGLPPALYASMLAVQAAMGTGPPPGLQATPYELARFAEFHSDGGASTRTIGSPRTVGSH
jgi:gamma-glutamylputrescine oxidase